MLQLDEVEEEDYLNLPTDEQPSAEGGRGCDTAAELEDYVKLNFSTAVTVMTGMEMKFCTKQPTFFIHRNPFHITDANETYVE